MHRNIIIVQVYVPCPGEALYEHLKSVHGVDPISALIEQVASFMAKQATAGTGVVLSGDSIVALVSGLGDILCFVRTAEAVQLDGRAALRQRLAHRLHLVRRAVRREVKVHHTGTISDRLHGLHHVLCMVSLSLRPRLLIYDSLFLHTRTIRKPLILGVQKCGCVGIGYLGDRNIRARSLKNGSILYEDFELRNEVTVTFPIEGIFQKTFAF